MPDQSFHASAPRLRRPWLSPTLPLRRLTAELTCGYAVTLVVAITSVSLMAQEPNAGNGAVNGPPPGVAVYEQGPYGSQPQIARPTPPPARYGDALSAAGQPWPGSQTERLAQNTATTQVIRPGVPTVQGTQPSDVQPSPESANRLLGVASPFDPSQFRLPTLGLPPGLGTPEPTPEVQREYGQFVEREIAPENTIQVVAGRAKVIVLREKARRIYIPDETVAGLQIVTDRQFAVVGKRVGRTVLNLWFPDPRDPNDQNKDRTLSYMVVVMPDPERAALDVLEERKRLEAQVTAFQQALKVLEREIKEAFPDSAVQLSLVGDQVVVRGESKDVIEAAQILRIVAQHTPTARRTKVDSKNVNVAFIPGLGDEQAAVNAIREILQGSPNMVNLLRVPGEQQVMLMVTVAEVNRTAARTIGMDFSIVNGRFAMLQGTGGLLTTVSAASSAAQALANVGGNLPTAIDNGNVLMAIQALRTLNFARSLAEPNLTTLNGKPANFQAGGSFPIPTSIVTPGGAAQSVTYQNFGVALQFVPYITDRDRIRLQLNASVTTPAITTTQVSGASVPSQIAQRQFSTTVELREGQTLTVAGLIQNNFSGTSKRIPLWAICRSLGEPVETIV